MCYVELVEIDLLAVQGDDIRNAHMPQVGIRSSGEPVLRKVSRRVVVVIGAGSVAISMLLLVLLMVHGVMLLVMMRGMMMAHGRIV